MKIVIDIPEDYYEKIKGAVDHGMDYMPCILIAKGTPLENYYEYKRFAEFVVGTCTSFAESNEDKAKDIINEIIYNKKKYPKLSLLWDQCCGNFS